MGYYLARKLGYMVVSLWIIITATFLLMKAVPGDPFTDERAVPPEILEQLYEHYGLNDPLPQQYLRYINSLLHGDLGPSFKYKGRSVNEIIANSFPTSAALGLEALALSLTFGVALGSMAASYHNKWQDRAAMLAAILGISIPSFIAATMLQYIFSIKLGWFPVARWGSFAQSVLPAVSLALLPTAFIARLTRSNMLEVLQQDYIKTAKAKGLSSILILWRHALRNALLPVMSYIGQLIASVLSGSFVVEKIFGIPGLGQWLVTSITNRDYTVIMGTTVFYGILLLVTMFFIDIAYAFLDPRIQLMQRKETL